MSQGQSLFRHSCDSYTAWLQVCLEASPLSRPCSLWESGRPGIPALGDEGDCHCSHPSGEGLVSRLEAQAACPLIAAAYVVIEGCLGLTAGLVFASAR